MPSSAALFQTFSLKFLCEHQFALREFTRCSTTFADIRFHFNVDTLTLQVRVQTALENQNFNVHDSCPSRRNKVFTRVL